MSFWLAVLVGGLFVWIAVQIGFYATWILMLNVALAVYMAIFLAPLVIHQIPEAAATAYGCAFTLVAIAVATLSIGYGISIALLSGRLRFPFPKAMDNVAAGLLGFLTGFLVWSFLAFSLCLTPLSKATFADTAGFTARSQRIQALYLCLWCDRLQAIVSASDFQLSTYQVMQSLMRQAGTLPKEEESSSDAAQTPPETTPPDDSAPQPSPPPPEPTDGPHSSPPTPQSAPANSTL